jgi:hypothetical protein
MYKLSIDQLKEINAGNSKYGIFTTITGAVVFIIGLIDGYVRPLKCN